MANTRYNHDVRDMFVPPPNPKIFHIIHVDRLPSVLADGRLLCDSAMAARAAAGPMIGLTKIKQRRLTQLRLNSHPGLFVGQCVPFYFCPRSVMLYLIHKANEPDLTYKGGQGPIVHLHADLRRVVNWAETNNRRWAFTLSNAGSFYFEDRSDFAQLNEVNWPAVNANWWQGAHKDGKQAEFLLETEFPWSLVDGIGVSSRAVANQVSAALQGAGHRPAVEIKADWYY